MMLTISFARFNSYRTSGGPAPRVSSKDRNCTLLGPKRHITVGTPLANLAPVKDEARNKTDPIYVLLASKTKMSFVCNLSGISISNYVRGPLRGFGEQRNNDLFQGNKGTKV